MPFRLSLLGNVSKYAAISRYGKRLHFSPRYLLIRTTRTGFKPPKRLSHRTFKASGNSLDRNLKVDIKASHNYESLAATGHVNKAKNMSTEHGQMDIDSSQKGNDDLSLPFWVFLWSFLAILAGFIYTKLNKQNKTEYEEKSSVHDTVNDEQIARKLVKEISRKDSAKQPTFRRQRSYEIIDGEVRIHYDVSMLDESLNKKTNDERFLLRSAEVESIPIRSSSLDELELIYPGNLPRIVEEGEDEVLELENKNDKQDSVYVNDSGPDAQICLNECNENLTNIAASEKDLNAEVIASNFEANGEPFETNGVNAPANFETVSNKEIIPITGSANNANGLPEKDSCDELNRPYKTNLFLYQSVDNNHELSSTSDESVIENSSSTSNASENSTHSSNTTERSVYKLTEVQRSEGHHFTVTRREVTKLKSSRENLVESSLGCDETSFSFPKPNESKVTAALDVNRSQVSKEEITASLTDPFSDKNIQYPDNLFVDKAKQYSNETFDEQYESNDKDEQFGRQVLDHVTSKEESARGEKKCWSIEDTKECSPMESVLTYLEEGSDILVDNSGDVLFKVIGSSIDTAFLSDTVEIDDIVDEIEENSVGKNEGDTLDENCQMFHSKDELSKSWKSLPSCDAVCNNEQQEISSNGLNTDNVDDDHSVGMSEDIQIKSNEIPDLEQAPNGEKGSGIPSDDSPMIKAQELIFDEEIKETSSLVLENKIGSRQTIFVKSSPEQVSSKNAANMETSLVETSLDVSSEPTTTDDGENVMMSEGKQDEDMMEGDESDEILLAQAVDMNVVEIAVPNHGGHLGVLPADDVVFARARPMEEDVLVAKIVTIETPSVEFGDSERNLEGNVSSSMKKSTTVFVDSEPDIKRVTMKNGRPLPDFTEQSSTTETNDDSVVHSDVASGFKPSPVALNSSTTNNNVQTIAEIASHTTVRSIVQRFEEARKTRIPLRAEPENIVSENNDQELVLDSQVRRNSSEGQNDVESQSRESARNENLDRDLSKNPVKDLEHRTPQETVTSVSPGESKLNATANSDDTLPNKDSMIKHKKIGFVNDACEINEVQPSSDNCISSTDPPNFLELKSDTSSNSVAGLVDEDVILASQVKELQETEVESFREHYDVEKAVSKDVVIPRKLNESEKSDEGVIYANQVCETEKMVDATECHSGQPSSQQGSVVSRTCTRVVYTGHFSELKTITNQTHVTSQTSNHITDDSHVSTTEASESHATDPTSTSSQLENHTPNSTPNFTPPSSPPTTYEFHETSFHEDPLLSSRVPMSPPEIREEVFGDEADVDSVSDVDEIDLDIIPAEESCRKSKSVTDLDEALASFEELNHLSTDDLDKENMGGTLSKSVPDILDSYREETLRIASVAASGIEKLQKKNLSLSTPEIVAGKAGKPGSKKVTKIKIVHVKFLEMQDGSGSENVQEDSFIYEGELPITGKMKSRSRNSSAEFNSPASSPPLVPSREVAQERSIVEKTDLKQLEFEFGDLFQNSPSPPPLEGTGQPTTASNPASKTDKTDSKGASKFHDPSTLSAAKGRSSYETVSQNSSRTESKIEVTDSTVQRSAKTATNSSRRVVLTQNSTEMPYRSSNSSLSRTHVRNDSKVKSQVQKPNENIISAFPIVASITSSTDTQHESSSVTRTTMNNYTRTKVAYQNVVQACPSPAASSGPASPARSESTSYRYSPGNARSYSKAPKPVPEAGRYVVKHGVVTTQATVKQTNSITHSPVNPSPSSSPRHAIKLSEKFHMSDGSEKPIDETGGGKNRKARVSSSKTSPRQSGKLVTVKSGIISDCSSDADSEMSYNAPSPRVKAKRYHRSVLHRDTFDSASSSEPDSPRRGQMKDERRTMSEVFGVFDEKPRSDVVRQPSSAVLARESDLGSRKLFSRFGDLEESEERTRHNTPEGNPSPVAEERSSASGVRSTETRSYHARYGGALERNLSPTSFLQEGNLAQSDDQMSPRTLEFNPFEEVEDGFQPFERCSSPSSVCSDTSSVFSFNCDFDPMPLPSGTFEPEVYTCENPTCQKRDILLGPEKTTFKSCPACFTYYCSSQCRKLHWPAHKQSCYFGRVNTYVRSIIRLCQRREDLSMYLSQLARDGYKRKGRGVVMAIFNSPELAREFITKGHDAFSGRKPTYSSLVELNREGIISKHRVALMQAVRDYEPNEEFVFNIAVVATNNIPITPAPRYKLNTVLHCIKMPLNEMIVARQPRDSDKVETRLFALPKCSRHEFVNEMEARRHYCRSLSKNLRQYNIRLKEDYPESYRRLCMYVEHEISFEPMTVYGQRNGLNYRCVIAPEQSYPLNAEYC